MSDHALQDTKAERDGSIAETTPFATEHSWPFKVTFD